MGRTTFVRGLAGALDHLVDQALDYGFIDQVITSAREAADEGRPARAKD